MLFPHLDKPSKILQTMIDGLRKQSQREDFSIAMGTFGTTIGEVCFGCAATCAAQEASGINYTPEVSIKYAAGRAETLGVETQDLLIFEHMIDRVRVGSIYSMFAFLGLNREHRSDYSNRWCMGSGNWEGEIPKVEKLIAELKEKDL